MVRAMTLKPRRESTALVWTIIVLVVFFSVFSGLLVSVTGPMTGVIFSVVLVGCAIAFSKNVLMWFGLSVAMIISGIAQLYYPPLTAVRWLIPMAAAGLVLHLLWQRLTLRNLELKFPAGITVAILFLVLALFTSVLNWRGLAGFSQGLKLYFQLWGLMFGLAFIVWPKQSVDRYLKFFFFVSLIQLPFAMQQYYFIVPERLGLWMLGVVPLDVVSGTLGADRLGSGKNMVLSAFLILTFSAVMALWRKKALSMRWVVISAPLLLTPLFLNESKYALVMLVISVSYVFRDDLLRKPAKAFLLIVILVAISSGLLVTYSNQFGQGRTVEETVRFTVESNLGDKGYGSLVLNRVSAIRFWADEHGFQDVSGTLIGHGLGSAHDTSESYLTSVKSLATTRYAGFGIGLTSLSMLLWDTGVIGTALIFTVFGAFFMSARALAVKYHADPWRSGTFEGMQVALICCLLMIPHNGTFVVDPVFQTMVYFIFGYIAYWTVQSRTLPTKIYESV